MFKKRVLIHQLKFMQRSDARILLLTPEYPPERGGIAGYLYGVVRIFPGHIEVVQGPFFSRYVWPHWLRGVLTAFKTARASRPQMIWISHILPMGYIVLIVGLFFRVPYCIFTHGMDLCLPLESKWKQWWARTILRRAALVVANSAFTAHLAEQYGISADRIHILYPGSQLFETQSGGAQTTAGLYLDNSTHVKNKNNPLYEKLRGKKIILSVGRLIPRKGQMRAAVALRPILKSCSDIHYVIIGTGADASLITRYIHEEKLKQSVTLLASIDNDELPRWYKAATLFLLPTVSNPPDVEGFGIVFAEAGAYGVPSVGGRGGGVDEVIEDGISGLLIDGSRDEEIRAAVLRLLSDGVLRRRLGEQGKVRARMLFNFQTNILSFAKHIYTLLPHPTPIHLYEDVIRQAMVSVIIPAYNHKAELRKTFDAIHAQTYKPLEIIVVDDGSTDGTDMMLEGERCRWSGLRSFAYFKIAHAGAAAARNAGVRHARGTLIIFWDADIIAEPRMLEKMAQTLKQNPHAAFVYSSFYFGWKKFICGPFDAERLKQFNYITTASLIRREFFPGFDESLERFQDWDVWLTIAARGGAGVWIPEPLFRIIPRKRGMGMSAWLPSFAYHFHILKNWSRIKDYRAAQARIQTKHRLI